MSEADIYFAANQRSWDERVAIHLADQTGFYRVAEVLAGADSLSPIEAAEIGDVCGLSIAHLQCHFGLDSLSLARRGADVTGLDFSAQAIAAARDLAAKTGVAVTFVEGNVYDARQLLNRDYDLAYVTWGTIGWLPDIAAWAASVASVVKPGGRLYFADGHPTTYCFDEIDGVIQPRYGWRTSPDRPFVDDTATTYNGSSTQLVHRRTYAWMHPISDIIGALRQAGFQLDWLHEHPALVWPLFASMTRSADGLYRLPDHTPQLPLAISLSAIKA